jgi:T-complex protein 1 subunit gamma
VLLRCACYETSVSLTLFALQTNHHQPPINNKQEPKACTILLRGASKDTLNEVERNLHDAMGVARNIRLSPSLVPGGGAVEMAVSRALSGAGCGRLPCRCAAVFLAHQPCLCDVGKTPHKKSTPNKPKPIQNQNQQNQNTERAPTVEGTEALPYRAAGAAMEVIPRTLAQNCGANVIRTLTKLRAKHAEAAAGGAPGAPGCSYGINGETGEITDMRALGVWEPLAVKEQTIKTAIESATLLLRIDDIVSGISKKGAPGGGGGGGGGPQVDDGNDVDPEAMLPE